MEGVGEGRAACADGWDMTDGKGGKGGKSMGLQRSPWPQGTAPTCQVMVMSFPAVWAQVAKAERVGPVKGMWVSTREQVSRQWPRMCHFRQI